MAHTVETIELIESYSFMGLLATKGQIPGVEGTPIAEEQRAVNKLFEVVGTKKTKPAFSFKIVRPLSWGKFSTSNNASGAFAH
ncbi:hypothetical protein [Kordiimonas aquimaris]|uniref:hypothetical protein n=1 Tax=Kordiimonas aquimaris TaxID=707591 RepID=UPI0021D1CE03|nr:hypothetical protein [Kordiimonas aquimaris]